MYVVWLSIRVEFHDAVNLSALEAKFSIPSSVPLLSVIQRNFDSMIISSKNIQNVRMY
jgi:hypothetical protein